MTRKAGIGGVPGSRWSGRRGVTPLEGGYTPSAEMNGLMEGRIRGEIVSRKTGERTTVSGAIRLSQGTNPSRAGAVGGTSSARVCRSRSNASARWPSHVLRASASCREGGDGLLSKQRGRQAKMHPAS